MDVALSRQWMRYLNRITKNRQSNEVPHQHKYSERDRPAAVAVLCFPLLMFCTETWWRNDINTLHPTEHKNCLMWDLLYSIEILGGTIRLVDRNSPTLGTNIVEYFIGWSVSLIKITLACDTVCRTQRTSFNEHFFGNSLSGNLVDKLRPKWVRNCAHL